MAVRCTSSVHREVWSPRSHRTLPIRIAIWLGCLATLCPPLYGQTDFGVAGSDSILWIHEQRADADGPRLTRLAFRRPSGEKPPGFQPLPIPGLTGRISAVAVRRDQLHAIFSDGTHWRFAPMPKGWHTTTPTVRSREANLPGQLVPTALACDPSDHSLYALAEGGPNNGQEPSQSGQASWRIFRYVQGAWTSDRSGPEVAPSASAVALAVRGKAIHLFYRVGSEGLRILHRTSASVEAAWSSPTAIFDTEHVVSFAPAWIGDRLNVLTVRRRTDGYTVRMLVAEDDDWRWGRKLREKYGAVAVFSGAPSCTMFGDEVVVAVATEEPGVLVGLWSPAEGNLVEPAQPVTALRPPTEPAAQKTRRLLIQYVILVLVLLAVFFRRRETVLALTPLPPQQTYARLTTRATAQLLDLTLTSPVWVTLIYLLLRSGVEDMTLQQQLALGPNGIPPSMYWSWAIVGACMAVYHTAFEAVGGGKTLGKRWARCVVVGNGGRPGSFGVICLRNVTRVIEFHIPPLALLVLLTPGRQRLGDILAGTFVVEVSRQNSGDRRQGSKGDESDT